MAQPTPYTRQYDFSNFQTVNPDDPLPATQVDAELNAVKTTLDETLANLALIQRDDGGIANGVVDSDALSADVTDWITEQIDQAQGSPGASAAAAAASAGAASTSANTATTQAGIATAAAIAASDDADAASASAAAAAISAAEAAQSSNGTTVAASGNDTTPGTLIQKIVAGSNITVTEVNDGGDEDISIAFDPTGMATDAELAAHTGNTSNPHSVTAAQAGALAIAQNLADLNSAATARTNLAVPGLADANTFTANQTITSTDAGAAIGPTQTLFRNSASPAASDVLGGTKYDGKDSGGNTETYAQIQAEITDPTNASEDGLWAVLTKVAGTLAKRIYVGAGLVIGSPTGGDKGAGTINCTGIYVNNVAVGTPVFSASFTSAEQTLSAGALKTLAHGLGARPKLIQVELKCLTAEYGWSIGDIFYWGPGFYMENNCGFVAYADSTNVYIRYGSNASLLRGLNKSTGALVTFTLNRWGLYAKAYV